MNLIEFGILSLDGGCSVTAGGWEEVGRSTATDSQSTGPNGVLSL